MIEIRIHGRGGQGVVTAAELIAVAAFHEGKFSQAFPSFGVERQGAPIESYVRIDDEFIRSRAHVYEPNFLIIQDPSLLEAIDPFKGVQVKAQVLINSPDKPKEIKAPTGLKIYTVSATDIALKHLGRPIINTVLLGAFAGITGLIKPNSLEKAILERFQGKMGQKNLAAMMEAYDSAVS